MSEFPTIPASYFIVNGKKIDLRPTGFTPGRQYERHCFSQLQLPHPDDTLLGPCLTNYLFSRGPFARLSKPDSLIFREDERSSDWNLIRLIECKSGAIKGIHEKIRGLALLLECLRTPENHFQALIRETLTEILQLPQTISVPQDHEIELMIVHSGDRRVTVEFETPPSFSVQIITIRHKH